MQPMSETARPTSATVLSRALDAKGGKVSLEGARFILSLGIREQAQQRMLDLLAEQQQGGMPDEERAELESYIQADNMLSILKAKALLALKQAGQEP